MRGGANVHSLRRLLLSADIQNTAWLKAIKVNLIKGNISEKYGKGLKSGEDKILCMEYANQAKTVEVLDKPLYFFRVKLGDASARRSSSVIGDLVYCPIIFVASMEYAAKWFPEEAVKLCAMRYIYQMSAWLGIALKSGNNWNCVREKVNQVIQSEQFKYGAKQCVEYIPDGIVAWGMSENWKKLKCYFYKLQIYKMLQSIKVNIKRLIKKKE